MVFDFLFITLYSFLSWSSSLWISSSAISESTLYNHVLACLPTGLLNSTRYSILFFTQSSSLFLNHMFIPSQPTTFNDSCDMLLQPTLNSSFVLLTFMETSHIHLIICCIFVFHDYTHSMC